MQESPAWRALSFADRGFYVELRRSLKSFNNGDISATMTTMQDAGVTSPATLAKMLRTLVAAGFLDKVRDGAIANGVRICSLYRFTDEPCLNVPPKGNKPGIKPMPATNEWQRFKTIEEARAAIAAVKDPTPSPVRKEARKNKSRIQKLYRDDTETVAMGASIDTETVVKAPPPTTKTVVGEKPQIARQPAPGLALVAHH